MKQRHNRKRLAACAGACTQLPMLRIGGKRVYYFLVGWRYWKGLGL
jgi:hypothetical protein